MSTNGTFPEASRRRGGGGRQEAALAALLAQPTHKAAAEACGISLRTLQRWLREPEFLEAYRQAKNQLVADATTQLRAAGGQAVQTLSRIASDEDAPPAAQVSAARSLLEFMFDAHELEELEGRIADLESRAQEEGNEQ